MAVAIGVATAPAAAATRAVDPPRIVPWHEIRNIGLGMSHVRVTRMYGRAVNGTPPHDTIVRQYEGRGVIGVIFDRNGDVESLQTASPAYATRSGIHTGTRITADSRHTWKGFTLHRNGGFPYSEWDRSATLGGPVRVRVQLRLGRDGRVDEIDLTRYLHCSFGDVVAPTCAMPPPTAHKIVSG